MVPLEVLELVEGGNMGLSAQDSRIPPGVDKAHDKVARVLRGLNTECEEDKIRAGCGQVYRAESYGRNDLAAVKENVELTLACFEFLKH